MGSGNRNRSSQAVRVIATAAASSDLTESTFSAAIPTNVFGTAHDAVDAGNPVKMGFKAIAHGANPTAVAAADRSVWYCNRHGVPWVIGGHPNVITTRVNYTTAQTDTAIATVGSGTKIVITQVYMAASVAITGILIGFGTANTPTGAGVVMDHQALAANGIASRGDGGGILGIGADGEDLRITTGTIVAGSLSVVVSYYTVES